MNFKILAVAFCWLLASCTKDLEVKRDQSQVIPATTAELQALLDDVNTMNNGLPGAGEAASDNLYVSDINWPSVASVTERNLYTWGADVFNDADNNDWTWPYRHVLNANIVLDAINNVSASSEGAREAVRGAALFYRAQAFFALAQVFCLPYREASAATDPGIVLRLTPAYDERSVRASVADSYVQIIKDLEEAVAILPQTPLYKTRPSKGAAAGLLARTLLSMGRYAEGGRWADSCLAASNTLMDYNTIDGSMDIPFTLFNDEVIFHVRLLGRAILFDPIGWVDTTLYQSYEADDLRRDLYFMETADGGHVFRGSYDGSLDLFGGIATDEMMLIKAEVQARQGDVAGSMSTLNTLLLNRYRQGSFISRSAATADEALALVLQERRKELVFRGLRWTDLRRLNAEPRWATTIRRTVEGVADSLVPADLRYTLPIPEKVVQLSGIEQNKR